MTLREAFDLGDHDIVSLVGGGGKTQLRDDLVLEYASRGHKAVSTLTTKTGPPARLPENTWVIEKDPVLRRRRLKAHLQTSPIAFTASHFENDHKIIGVEPEWIGPLKKTLVMIESDGARKKPLKAPACYEPVIAPATTVLVAVVGGDCLDSPLEESRVHRTPIFSKVTGLQPGQTITPALLSDFIPSSRGYMKGRPKDSRFFCFINKVNDRNRASVTALVKGLLDSGRLNRVIWGDLKKRQIEWEKSQ